MKKARILAAAAALLFAANASAQTVTIGDKDCFGGAGGAGPATCSAFTIPSFPSDFRSAGEQAAVNGAQQTDFYSALFEPLGSSFTMTLPTTGTITSATFSYRVYGLQATDLGPFAVTFNGTATNAFNFEDGSDVIAIHTFNFTGANLASLNTNNGLTVSMDRVNSNDAVAFDYFELNYTTSSSVVPEPSTYALMGAGLLAIGFARRRRRSA